MLVARAADVDVTPGATPPDTGVTVGLPSELAKSASPAIANTPKKRPPAMASGIGLLCQMRGAAIRAPQAPQNLTPCTSRLPQFRQEVAATGSDYISHVT